MGRFDEAISKFTASLALYQNQNDQPENKSAKEIEVLHIHEVTGADEMRKAQFVYVDRPLGWRARRLRGAQAPRLLSSAPRRRVSIHYARLR